MKKIIAIFFFIFFTSFNTYAANVNIAIDYKKKLECKFEKIVIKNQEYNYKTFLAKDIDDKDLNKFDIKAKKPDTLFINGLSLFLSDSKKLNVKVVNKDVVLFKASDKKKNYSESAIINRKSGELVHEITRNIKSENSEKDIFFYSCSKRKKNA